MTQRSDYLISMDSLSNTTNGTRISYIQSKFN